MPRHRALFIILCFRLAGLIRAASLRNEDNAGQNIAESSDDQPQRLVTEDVADKPYSLLAIMQGLQQRRPPAAVASEVQVERRDMSGQSLHERQLMKDMGRLEGQLESWKEAEQNLELQVAKQAETVEAMRAHEAKAIHDEQVAAVVWWDCKMLMCVVLASGLAYCIYTTSSQNLKSSFNVAGWPDSLCWKTEEGQSPQPTRRARAQPEFVEKDAQPEAEDILEVSLSHPAPVEKPDIEAPHAGQHSEDVCHTGTTSVQEKPVEPTKGKSEEDFKKGASQCQYFTLEEEPETQNCSPEEAWWMQSTSAY